MLWVILFIAVVIGLAVVAGDARERRLRKAREAYHASLVELKRDPANPDRKQHALALGRAYSKLTRDRLRVTVFDEVALSNDISAACAGAMVPRVVAAPSLAPTPEARLARLSSLRAQGLLDDDEYATERRRIISEL